MHRMRAPNRRRRRLGQTEEADFARFDELRHRADCLLDRDLRIDAMLIVEIDDVDLQPLQTRIALLEDILPIAAHAEKLVVRTAHVPELRCDHHILAPAGYRFPTNSSFPPFPYMSALSSQLPPPSRHSCTPPLPSPPL